jgi:plastocyanin
MTRIGAVGLCALGALVATGAGCGDAGPASPGPGDLSGVVVDFSGPDLLVAVAADVVVGASGALTFSQKQVSVHPGDSVRWTWATSGHTVTSGDNGVADGKFCSPTDSNCGAAVVSNSGFVYVHKFTTAGTFNYFCAPHVLAGMTGTITVQ